MQEKIHFYFHVKIHAPHIFDLYKFINYKWALKLITLGINVKNAHGYVNRWWLLNLCWKMFFFFWVVPIIFCVVFVFLKMLFTFYGLYVKWEKMYPIWNLKRPILQIYIQWCSCGWRNVCPVAGRFWILHCFLLFEVFFFQFIYYI